MIVFGEMEKKWLEKSIKTGSSTFKEKSQKLSHFLTLSPHSRMIISSRFFYLSPTQVVKHSEWCMTAHLLIHQIAVLGRPSKDLGRDRDRTFRLAGSLSGTAFLVKASYQTAHDVKTNQSKQMNKNLICWTFHKSVFAG